MIIMDMTAAIDTTTNVMAYADVNRSAEAPISKPSAALSARLSSTTLHFLAIKKLF